MINLKLTNGNFKWIAERLGNCEPEMVMAVTNVECPREPFDSTGFPSILFERHKFWKNANRAKREQWHKDFPEICGPSAYGPGGYGSYGEQKVKYNKAYSLDPDAAMEACSWGAFQELGENYIDYGFRNVGEFVDMMKDGLWGQCTIFIKSVHHRGLVDELQNCDFQTFARLYNGGNYRVYKYDAKMHSEYIAAKSRKIDWSKIVSAEPPHATFKPSNLAQLPAPKSQAQPGPEPVAQPEVEDNKTEDVQSPESQEVDDQSESTDTGATSTKTEISVDKDTVSIKKETDGKPLPKENVVVLKSKPPGAAKRMWTKLSLVTGGQITLQAVRDQLEPLQSLNLSPRFWGIITLVLLIASGVWIAHEMIKSYQERKRASEIDQLLVKENSTPDNYVRLVDPEDEQLYRARGYKVITQ